MHMNSMSISRMHMLKSAIRDFLCKHENYEKFLANLKRQRDRGIDEFLIRKMSPTDDGIWFAQEVINFAFAWYQTPEGHEYWAFMDQLWRSYVTANKTIWGLSIPSQDEPRPRPELD